MPDPHSRHVALTEPLARFVDSPVAQGRCATANQVMRAALRLLMDRENAQVGVMAANEQGDLEHG